MLSVRFPRSLLFTASIRTVLSVRTQRLQEKQQKKSQELEPYLEKLRDAATAPSKLPEVVSIFRDIELAYLRPDRSVYNLVLLAHANSSSSSTPTESEDVDKVIEAMRLRKISLTPTSYLLATAAYLNSSPPAPENAEKLVEEMEENTSARATAQIWKEVAAAYRKLNAGAEAARVEELAKNVQ